MASPLRSFQLPYFFLQFPDLFSRIIEAAVGSAAPAAETAACHPCPKKAAKYDAGGNTDERRHPPPPPSGP